MQTPHMKQLSSLSGVSRDKGTRRHMLGRPLPCPQDQPYCRWLHPTLLVTKVVKGREDVRARALQDFHQEEA